MKVTSFYPVSFSQKGIKSLFDQIKRTSDFEILEKNGLLNGEELKNSAIMAYYDLATSDDKSTIFCKEDGRLVIPNAYFEVKSNHQGIITIDFDIDDFELKNYENT